MDATGALSLSDRDGGCYLHTWQCIIIVATCYIIFSFSTAIFDKVHIKWISDRTEEIFSLKSQAYPQLFLAVDTRSPNYSVRGMVSNCVVMSIEHSIISCLFRPQKIWGINPTAIGNMSGLRMLWIVLLIRVILPCDIGALVLAVPNPLNITLSLRSRKVVWQRSRLVLVRLQHDMAVWEKFQKNDTWHI